MKKAGWFVAAMVLAFGSYAKADSVLVGSPGSTAFQDCVPFGCQNHAQFVYDSSYFSGPVTIVGLTFFNSVEGSTSTFDPANYTFSLSTTASSSTAPSSAYADNRGDDFSLFNTVALSGPIPPVFSVGGTPFSYDPGDGNLLLEVSKDGADTFSGFTDYNSDSEFLVSRVWGNDAETGAVDENYGPVTQFELQSEVPEPATLTLTGLGILGVVRRLRKNKKAETPAV